MIEYPQKKLNTLGVKVPCYSFLDCIVIGKSLHMKKYLKVSEEKVVTGSQIWTVGRMVKLYEATFPYSSPQCARLVCMRVHCYEEAGHQPTTYHGVSV